MSRVLQSRPIESANGSSADDGIAASFGKPEPPADDRTRTRPSDIVPSIDDGMCDRKLPNNLPSKLRQQLEAVESMIHLVI